MGAKAKSSSGARRKKRGSKQAAKAGDGEQHRYYPDSVPPGMAHEVFDVSRIDEDGLEVLDDDEVETESLPPPATAPRSLRARAPSRAPHPPRPSSRPPPGPVRSHPVPRLLDADDLHINTPLSYAGNPDALPAALPPEASVQARAATSSGRTLGYLVGAAVVALLVGLTLGSRADAPSLAAHADARSSLASPLDSSTSGRFSRAKAEIAIDAAIARAKACHGAATAAPLVARLTFAQTGQVVGVEVSGPLAGTEAGSCFAAALREARVPAFDGGLQTVERTVATP